MGQRVDDMRTRVEQLREQRQDAAEYRQRLLQQLSELLIKANMVHPDDQLEDIGVDNLITHIENVASKQEEYYAQATVHIVQANRLLEKAATGSKFEVK